MKSINELEVNTSTYSGSCYPVYLLLELQCVLIACIGVCCTKLS